MYKTAVIGFFLLFCQVCQAQTPLMNEIKSCRVAWDNAKKGDFTAAIENTSEKCPLSKDYFTWETLRSDKYTQTFDTYDSFIQTHKTWPWMHVLRKKAEQALMKEESDEKVLQWFAHNEIRTPQGGIRYLGALKSDTQKKTTLRKLWASMELSVSEQATLLKTYGDLLTAADHKKRVWFLLDAHNTKAAKVLIDRLDAKDKVVAQKRLKILEGELAGFKVEDATHDEVYDFIRMARKKDTAQGTKVFLSLPKNKTKTWWRERNYLAREALNVKDYKMAYAIMSDHPFEAGESFAEAEWFCGWISLRYLNKPEQALAHFQKLRTKIKHEKTIARAEYWLGRTYDALGKSKESVDHYKLAAKHVMTFYGQMALRQLEHPLQVAYKPSTEPRQWPWLEFQSTDLIPVARLLQYAGMPDAALPFLYIIGKRAKTKQDGGHALFLVRQILPHYTIFFTKDVGLKITDITVWSYPVMELDKRVSQVDTDHDLVHSIIRQESGFSPRLISSAGAMGMMQVMPGTGKLMADKNNYQFTKSQLIDDAGFNVLLGAHYLKGRLDQFDGSKVLAIAAYNAGPTPVKKWIDRFGHPEDKNVDTIDWIESISYSETRSYVKSVLANYYVYKGLRKS